MIALGLRPDSPRPEACSAPPPPPPGPPHLTANLVPPAPLHQLTDAARSRAMELRWLLVFAGKVQNVADTLVPFLGPFWGGCWYSHVRLLASAHCPLVCCHTCAGIFLIFTSRTLVLRRPTLLQHSKTKHTHHDLYSSFSSSDLFSAPVRSSPVSISVSVPSQDGWSSTEQHNAAGRWHAQHRRLRLRRLGAPPSPCSR